MARTNPLQFIQQVRAETAKVVWPTRREVGLTTVMVMIMATLFATFFFLVDLLIRFGARDDPPLCLLNPRPGGCRRRLSERISGARRFGCAPVFIARSAQARQDRGRAPPSGD